ncbi:hypothetical protein FNF27_07180 [Cafeteria roenbergensis]|uniref:Uncharacterized protein n=1 Tax=Cafeteria roenbergensis TaxID=33653 RepID=A0A5A8DWS2_CAFRO|nr:hypothetical protein FNF27_07180 [Cafeteria roenbergensis]
MSGRASSQRASDGGRISRVSFAEDDGGRRSSARRSRDSSRGAARISRSDRLSELLARRSSRNEATILQIQADARASGGSSLRTFVTQTKTLLSSKASTFNADKINLFGAKAPKERDDSGLTLQQLLADEGMSLSDARLLMDYSVFKGEFPDEASKRRQRQARLANKVPKSQLVMDAAKRVHKLRSSGERCEWTGTDYRGKQAFCTNKRLVHPSTGEHTPFCAYHQRMCVAQHPSGLVPITHPNSLGVCSTHFAARFGQQPRKVRPGNVPGVEAFPPMRIGHPLAPGSPPSSDDDDDDDDDDDSSSDSSNGGAEGGASSGKAEGVDSMGDAHRSSGQKQGPATRANAALSTASDNLGALILKAQRAQLATTGVVPDLALRAVVRIQANMRRRLAALRVRWLSRYKRIAARESAVIAVQRAFRARRLAKDYPFMQLATHVAAVTIQRAFRRWRLDSALRRDRVLRRAAITVQRWVRGVNLRFDFRQMRIRLRGRVMGTGKAKALLVVAGFVARYIAQFRVRKASIRRQSRQAAARVLQRSFRAFLGRKRQESVRREIKERFRRSEAARFIEQFWLARKRKRNGRRNRHMLLCSIMSIQAVARGMLGRLAAKRRRDELASAWRWMNPRLPAALFDELRVRPKYEEMFDLSRFIRDDRNPALVWGAPGRDVLEAPPEGQLVPHTPSQAVAAAFPGAVAPAPLRSLSASRSAVDFSRTRKRRPTRDPSTVAQRINAGDAEGKRRRHQEDEANAAAIVDEFEARCLELDSRRTGLLTRPAVRRLVREAGLPRAAGRKLAERCIDVRTSKVAWTRMVRMARHLGTDLESAAGITGVDSTIVFESADRAVAVTGTANGDDFLHLPPDARQAHLQRLSSDASDAQEHKMVANRIAGRSLTAAGAMAFRPVPELKPAAAPDGVAGVKGSAVEETVALLPGVGGRGRVVAAVVDQDVMDLDRPLRSPAAMRLRQAVLSSWIGLAGEESHGAAVGGTSLL